MSRATQPTVIGETLSGSLLLDWRAQAAPTRPALALRGLDGFADHLVASTMPWRVRAGPYLARAEAIVNEAARHVTESDQRLVDACAPVRAVFRTRRATPHDVDHALSLLTEIFCRRCGLRAHPVQIAAAIALWDRRCVELATGEGKSFAIVFAAALYGWLGRGCHVLTVNDYLAERDALFAKRLLVSIGVTVGCVRATDNPEDRRVAYRADVTYCTNKTVAADLLRDRILRRRQRGKAIPAAMSRVVGTAHAPGLLRGLEAAIVDEADSVLIDEAETPLLISATPSDSAIADFARTANEVATSLDRGTDFTVDTTHRTIELTDAGRDRIERSTAGLSGIWASQRRSEELVSRSLQARWLFHRDVHYLVRDGAIEIIDESTGRTMPDRTWRDGLHAAIEAKEDLEISPPRVTVDRISFQRFFRMYGSLAATTGTAREVRHELWRTYRLPVVVLPTHRPCVRRKYADRYFASLDSKLDAIVGETLRLVEYGRPVLIGTRSVEVSERVSRRLAGAGLPHDLLNAARPEEEASIIARAGAAARVTVATNMAGRGTDISLTPESAAAGGLHVIMTERHGSRRIDRQLAGRAGRQGDPGSSVGILSLDDELLDQLPQWLARFLRRTEKADLVGPRAHICRAVARLAQASRQATSRRRRQAVLREDEWLDDSLSASV